MRYLVAYFALSFVGAIFGPGTHFGALDGFSSEWNPYTLTCLVLWLLAIYAFVRFIREVVRYS